MITIVALIILLPFAAAVAGLLGTRAGTGRRGGGSRTEPPDAAAGRRAAWFAITASAASAVLTSWLALRLALDLPGGVASWPGGGGFWDSFLPGRVEGALTLIETGSLPISVSLRGDGLSVLTGILVVMVASAVQVYSVGYMRGEPRYPSYSAFIGLFTSAMLLVVYAGDLIVLYVGWEIMGICSYLLIGHWWEDRANSRAAVKAFLVTRLGDVGFLFGIFTLGMAAGSFRIDDVLRADIPTGTLIVATLLLLMGVAGKSAQVPLQTWLPDAMAGPAPISALIHAATMVAAGVFVVARLYPLFLGARPTLDALAVIAAIGMLGAALAALAQDDLKRVLAHSTISQLAYMAGALAAGVRGTIGLTGSGGPNGPDVPYGPGLAKGDVVPGGIGPAGVRGLGEVGGDQAAIFHLLSHGAFKALLFLCAGVVIHHAGSNLMSRMGGLRAALPVTFWTMTIGFAALAGLPPSSGFFGKNAVISVIEGSDGVIQPFLYGSALLTVGVTGAYAARAWLRTFFGPARSRGEPPPGTAVHVFGGREAPRSMLWPIGVLTVPTLLLGVAWPWFAGRGVIDSGAGGASAAVDLVVALLGAGIVYALWRGDPVRDPARLLGPFRAPCERAFYADAVYAAMVARPVLRLARGVVRTDERVIDGAVRWSGRAAIGLSGVVRLVQNGNAQLYVTGLVAGLLLIAVTAAVVLA
ncbi:NADH-quinone oxidoreductase subunit L [Sphaerimonospora sp. CA-214678]|uniref:NADH-quinone oxidoreductase subunit 5 family protein n=1 Tax=Sphaerimonospora sp. CA-214678 TaxID=3240029 RepID=UPI003D910695